MFDITDSASLDDLIRLAVAVAIGFLIGFEREHTHAAEARSRNFAGARTFALTAFVGALAGLVDDSLIIPAVALLAVAGLTALAYWSVAREQPGSGGTTEIALFVTFLLGLAASHGHVLAASVGGVATAIILSVKQSVQRWAAALSEEELNAALRFLAISVIILPVLPDEAFGPYDALNARDIWLMVVFISGLSFLGYWLIRFVGAGRGIVLTGLVGGLASSTATTLSLSRFAKNGAEGRQIAAGIVAANVMMLARVAALTTAIARDALAALWPGLVAGGVAGIVAALVLWRRQAAGAQAESMLEVGNPMEIKPALMFAALLAVISLAASFGAEQFGQSGLFIVALVSGLADVDAITLIAGRQAAGGGIDAQAAAIAIMIAVAANIFLKGAMAWAIGGRSAGAPVAVAFIAMVLAGAAGLALFQ